jgi:acetyl/propionyl-CoA carboxylase alpha subunit
MNTRLQVEHPVTEMVTGLDLVREQIRIARGERLGIEQETVEHNGAAIECRLYAEDTAAGDLPATGTIAAWRAPDWVRVDAGVRGGSTVGIHYDPMLAKIIAHAPTRSDAIRTLARALDRLVVFGVATNRELLAAVLRHPVFTSGAANTHFLAEHGHEVRPRKAPVEDIELAACAIVAAGFELRRASRTVLPALEPGYRSNRFADERVVYHCDGEPLVVEYLNLGRKTLRVRVGEAEPVSVRITNLADGAIGVEIAGRRVSIPVCIADRRCFALVRGKTIELIEEPRFPESQSAAIEGGCVAPMPGKVTRLLVEDGASVSRGDTLVVLEAMKMEHTVRAPSDGVITELCVAIGDQVDADDLLVVVKAAD